MIRLFKNNYDSFNNSLTLQFCTIPINGTNYVPQGICHIKDYILVACYDYKREFNSIIFVCLKNSTKRILLDEKIHCGGIAYHEESDSLFVTGKGVENNSFINRYCGKDFITKSDLSTVFVDKKFCVDSDNSLYSSSAKHSSPSYLAIYKNCLYVGNFVDSNSMSKNKAIIKKYKILSSGNLSTKYDVINNPFSNTQGFCIFEYNNEEYYIFSRSFGRKRNSIINICRYNGEFYDIKAVVFPAMLEQISSYKCNLITVFESCADCYSKSCITYNDGVYFMDFKKLLSCDDDFKCFVRGSKLFTSHKSIDIKGNYGQ